MMIFMKNLSGAGCKPQPEGSFLVAPFSGGKVLGIQMTKYNMSAGTKRNKNKAPDTVVGSDQQ